MERIACNNCGAKALPSTIEKTGGLCMPCFKGRSSKSLHERLEDTAIRMGIMHESDRVAHLSNLKTLTDLDEPLYCQVESNEIFPFGKTYKDVLSQSGKEDDLELLNNLSAIIMNKETDSGLGSLTDNEIRIYVIAEMITEVNNGGFAQFFYNSSGEIADYLISSLDSVGSSEYHSIASNAMDILGEITSFDEENRHNHLNKITQGGDLDLWKTCDDAFYNCEENIELMAINNARYNLL